MSTHGNLVFIDRDGKQHRDKVIWLHAYSNSHAADACEMLNTLPEFFVGEQ